MLAVDVSNYSGEISEQQARDLWDAGVRKVIVQLVNENVLTHRQQIPVLINAGMEVEAYVYLWFSAGEEFVRGRVAWACRELGGFARVGMLWLDCEQADTDDPPFDFAKEPTTHIIKAAHDVATRAGYRTGIYTAGWWWGPGTSNSRLFSYLPLWSAQYDGDPTLGPAGYGGWGMQTMKQYQGSTTLAGVPMVDLNVYGAVSPVTQPSPVSEIAPIVTPLPNGEFLPEPEESDAAAFYRAAMLGPQPDSEIVAIPPEREGWAYWKFGVKR